MAYITDEKTIIDSIPERSREAHKGDFGRVLIIAGSRTMTGACILSVKAALRSGSGLVYAAVDEEIMSVIQVAVPEAITVYRNESLIERLDRYDAIAIGPGLGLSSETGTLVSKVIENAECPIVVDADGLNAVAEYKLKSLLKKRAVQGRTTVITPHMGEAERLLRDVKGFSFDDASREEIAEKLFFETGAVSVLKGNNTLIRTDDDIYANPTGNPGMATAGSGDVLTGIIVSLLGQHLNNAVVSGVYIHGMAGDFAAEKLGEYSLIASDIVNNISNSFIYLRRKA